jgi:hypothetical protein
MDKTGSACFSRVVLVLIGFQLAAAAGCNDGTQAQVTNEVAPVHVALTVVPSGVQCVRLNLSGSVTSSLTFTLATGASSASLSLGYVPTGSLSVAPSAFNVACTSLTSTTVPSWTGATVTVTVVAGTPLAIPLTLEPYNATATVNFVPFVKAVSTGGSSSYALLSDGTVRAWGFNANGAVGDGTTVDRWTPVTVSGLSAVVALATGGGAGGHMCALKTGGSVSCWGYNA